MFFPCLALLHSFIALLLCFSPASSAPAPAPAPQSTYQWQSQLTSRTDWQKYVRSPASNIVRPVSIVPGHTQGNVFNPSGLLTGAGETTLTRTYGATPPAIVVDFGKNVAGYLSIKFTGSSAFNYGPFTNSTSTNITSLPGIRLAFSETLEYLTDLSDFSRSNNGDTITPGSDQIAVQRNPYTWTDALGCQYQGGSGSVCADGLHGFRYVKVYLDALPYDDPYTTSYGWVSIGSMSLNYTAFLGTPDTFTGWFESSDDQLNQWWYDGVYTNDLCTDTFRADSSDPRDSASPTLIGLQVLLDGAKRDRDPYVGDIAVAGRTTYLTHNNAQAAKNVLADLANHQRADGWIPPASIDDYQLPLLDYPLWWVVCSYDLYMYTGDTGYVQTYYPNMVKVLDTFYPNITDPFIQLISKGIGISGGYGDYAFINRNGPVTYYNALYVLALNNAASIATSLGHDADATRWSARARVVSSAINTYNFDSTVGAFFDGACGPNFCPTHAQDGNSLSIVSGVANLTVANSVLSYMSAAMSRPYGNAFYDNDVVSPGFSQRVYAFISYFEIEARFMTGKASSALEEIRRLYGWMASHDPGITMWEGIADNGTAYEGSFTSMAHGWSTGIVPALVNNVLGVTPTGPGFSSYNILPMLGDLAWAKGSVPTPHGPITVSWAQGPHGNGQFAMNVKAAAGMTGKVSVPVANSSTPVYVDSTLVWDHKGKRSFEATYEVVHESGYVTVTIGDGDSHTLSAGFNAAQ